MLAAVLAASVAAADDVCLEPVARYAGVPNSAKHLLGVEQVLDHHALMTSANAIRLIDLELLHPNDQVIASLSTVVLADVYSTVTRDDGWVFANLRRRGFAILHLDAGSLDLTLHGELHEPGVFYDNMTVAGDRLYVPAHAYGIRIFDISNPVTPVLIGSLEEGFDDAFHIAIDGTTAYVADGAGGLKIVDLSNELQPVIIDGEDPHTAAGTAEHVLVHEGRVYVACGGAGVAVYEAGDLSSRALHDTPICAKALALVGVHLAVADIGGIEVFAFEPDGSLALVARERAARRYWNGAANPLRLWHGVAAWGDDRILAANWDWVDVYELVSLENASKADVTASTQRVRFPPQGGTEVVQLFNDSCVPLLISDISSTAASFEVTSSAMTIPPGESIDVSIEYGGGHPGAGLVLVSSNDPDETPLPIQVYGQTQYLDPGELAVGFTAESWVYDHEAGEFHQEAFDLEAEAGRLVYFHLFAVG
jgi:hypothetical protein